MKGENILQFLVQCLKFSNSCNCCPLVARVLVLLCSIQRGEHHILLLWKYFDLQSSNLLFFLWYFSMILDFPMFFQSLLLDGSSLNFLRMLLAKEDSSTDSHKSLGELKQQRL